MNDHVKKLALIGLLEGELAAQSIHPFPGSWIVYLDTDDRPWYKSLMGRKPDSYWRAHFKLTSADYELGAGQSINGKDPVGRCLRRGVQLLVDRSGLFWEAATR